MMALDVANTGIALIPRPPLADRIWQQYFAFRAGDFDEGMGT